MIRLRLVCRGAVQGVGFRPAVHRLATAAGLCGWVSNDPIGATLEVEGEREAVETFVERLRSELPP
ncbi:MAG: acylphosphatase, partial [Acidobacteriota bacterium]